MTLCVVFLSFSLRSFFFVVYKATLSMLLDQV